MKRILFSLTILIAASSCSKEEENPFLISKGTIGKLTKDTTVAELDAIFANDSLVKRIGEGDYAQAGSDMYIVYEKGGKRLFSLVPKEQHDPDETIADIQIFDGRFTSVKGIGLKSTFKDITENHKIDKIENTLRNVVIFVNELDAYFTIDKKELPADLRYDSTVKIEATQIPDDAEIKFFMISW
ncbi:hypothetical protein ACFQ1M_00790 [Sungkyunkwania multivorans]|uniref:Lipoprotein n=1 Tax=Sungkyunkwania multivorans TaxID=1173618 RepID=A0ABW3CSN9_9FLAO